MCGEPGVGLCTHHQDCLSLHEASLVFLCTPSFQSILTGLTLAPSPTPLHHPLSNNIVSSIALPLPVVLGKHTSPGHFKTRRPEMKQEGSQECGPGCLKAMERSPQTL